MSIVKKEVDYAKEAGEVMDLAVAVVEHFKAGKSVAEATELLDELVTAVSGADQLDDEWEANREAVTNSVLLGASKMVNVLTKKKEEEPEA